jgi:predicted RNase H-like HicB family nuclease
MHNIKYVIYKEDKYYVSQCLNVDVSSFGDTIDEATKNLLEAVELYFDNSQNIDSYIPIDQILIGEGVVSA